MCTLFQGWCAFIGIDFTVGARYSSTLTIVPSAFVHAHKVLISIFNESKGHTGDPTININHDKLKMAPEDVTVLKEFTRYAECTVQCLAQLR